MWSSGARMVGEGSLAWENAVGRQAHDLRVRVPGERLGRCQPLDGQAGQGRIAQPDLVGLPVTAEPDRAAADLPAS